MESNQEISTKNQETIQVEASSQERVSPSSAAPEEPHERTISAAPSTSSLLLPPIKDAFVMRKQDHFLKLPGQASPESSVSNRHASALTAQQKLLGPKMGKVWKVNRAILRGTKLYFYKPPPSVSIDKSIFSGNQGSTGKLATTSYKKPVVAAPPVPIQNKSAKSTDSSFVKSQENMSAKSPDALSPLSEKSTRTGLVLTPNLFDRATRLMLFPPKAKEAIQVTESSTELNKFGEYIFGDAFIERDPGTLEFKQHLVLLLFKSGTVMVLTKKWVQLSHSYTDDDYEEDVKRQNEPNPSQGALDASPSKTGSAGKIWNPKGVLQQARAAGNKLMSSGSSVASKAGARSADTPESRHKTVGKIVVKLAYDSSLNVNEFDCITKKVTYDYIGFSVKFRDGSVRFFQARSNDAYNCWVSHVCALRSDIDVKTESINATGWSWKQLITQWFEQDDLNPLLLRTSILAALTECAIPGSDAVKTVLVEIMNSNEKTKMKEKKLISFYQEACAYSSPDLIQQLQQFLDWMHSSKKDGDLLDSLRTVFNNHVKNRPVRHIEKETPIENNGAAPSINITTFSPQTVAQRLSRWNTISLENAIKERTPTAFLMSKIHAFQSKKITLELNTFLMLLPRTCLLADVHVHPFRHFHPITKLILGALERVKTIEELSREISFWLKTAHCLLNEHGDFYGWISIVEAVSDLSILRISKLWSLLSNDERSWMHEWSEMQNDSMWGCMVPQFGDLLMDLSKSQNVGKVINEKVSNKLSKCFKWYEDKWCGKRPSWVSNDETLEIDRWIASTIHPESNSFGNHKLNDILRQIVNPGNVLFTAGSYIAQQEVKLNLQRFHSSTYFEPIPFSSFREKLNDITLANYVRALDVNLLMQGFSAFKFGSKRRLDEGDAASPKKLFNRSLREPDRRDSNSSAFSFQLDQSHSATFLSGDPQLFSTTQHAFIVAVGKNSAEKLVIWVKASTLDKFLMVVIRGLRESVPDLLSFVEVQVNGQLDVLKETFLHFDNQIRRQFLQNYHYFASAKSILDTLFACWKQIALDRSYDRIASATRILSLLYEWLETRPSDFLNDVELKMSFQSQINRLVLPDVLADLEEQLAVLKNYVSLKFRFAFFEGSHCHQITDQDFDLEKLPGEQICSALQDGAARLFLEITDHQWLEFISVLSSHMFVKLDDAMNFLDNPDFGNPKIDDVHSFLKSIYLNHSSVVSFTDSLPRTIFEYQSFIEKITRWAFDYLVRASDPSSRATRAKTLLEIALMTQKSLGKNNSVQRAISKAFFLDETRQFSKMWSALKSDKHNSGVSYIRVLRDLTLDSLTQRSSPALPTLQDLVEVGMELVNASPELCFFSLDPHRRIKVTFKAPSKTSQELYNFEKFFVLQQTFFQMSRNCEELNVKNTTNSCGLRKWLDCKVAKIDPNLLDAVKQQEKIENFSPSLEEEICELDSELRRRRDRDFRKLLDHHRQLAKTAKPANSPVLHGLLKLKPSKNTSGPDKAVASVKTLQSAEIDSESPSHFRSTPDLGVSSDSEAGEMSSKNRPVTLLSPKSPHSKLNQSESPIKVVPLLEVREVRPAKDYVKKKHVFIIGTNDGEYIMVQALSDREMKDWVEKLTKVRDEVRRQIPSHSYPMDMGDGQAKHMEDDKDQDQAPVAIKSILNVAGSWFNSTVDRFKKDLGSSTTAIAKDPKRAVFGTDFLVVLMRELQAKNANDILALQTLNDPCAIEWNETNSLPAIVEKCVSEVEQRGLTEVGIYRLSGMASTIKLLKTQFDNDSLAVDLSASSVPDINAITGLLKLYFREMPEPLMTFRLCTDFIHAIDLPDYNERLWALKDTLYKLPAPNFYLCKYLIGHLVHITEHEDVNQMFATNLAIVFGPTLMRYPGTNPNTAEGMQYLGQFSSIVKNMIIQYHWLFDVGTGNTEKGAAESTSAEAEKAAVPDSTDNPFADPDQEIPDDLSEPEQFDENIEFEEEEVKGLVGEEFGMDVGLESPAVVDYYLDEDKN